MFVVTEVVVVTGEEVCCVVVVELLEPLSVPHPANDNRTTAARQGMMNFFMRIILVWFFT